MKLGILNMFKLLFLQPEHEKEIYNPTIYICFIILGYCVNMNIKYLLMVVLLDQVLVWWLQSHGYNL